MAEQPVRITSLSFDKIIATVPCPWRDCRAPQGSPCRYYDGMEKDVPHKSRFKSACKKLEEHHAKH